MEERQRVRFVGWRQSKGAEAAVISVSIAFLAAIDEDKNPETAPCHSNECTARKVCASRWLVVPRGSTLSHSCHLSYVCAASSSKSLYCSRTAASLYSLTSPAEQHRQHKVMNAIFSSLLTKPPPDVGPAPRPRSVTNCSLKPCSTIQGVRC